MKDILPERKEDLVFRDEKNKKLVFDPEENNITVLDNLSYFILKACDGETKKEELIDLLEEETDKTKDDISSFLENAIKKMKEGELLKG